MNYYLRKYVGKYRVKAEIDLNTNDFCRDENGNLENNLDIYIKCSNGIRIYHYGGNVLEVYIPSIGRGHNIVKSIATDILGLELNEYNSGYFNYGKFYKDISEKELLYDFIETDSELLFKIKDKNLDKIVTYLKPQTSGANISPMSSRNLKHGMKKYEYTQEQIEEYKKITDKVKKEDKLSIGKWNSEFLDKILRKKIGVSLEVLKSNIKKENMSTKDYIYFKGYEQEYLNFLTKEINKKYENQN